MIRDFTQGQLHCSRLIHSFYLYVIMFYLGLGYILLVVLRAIMFCHVSLILFSIPSNADEVDLSCNGNNKSSLTI